MTTRIHAFAAIALLWLTLPSAHAQPRPGVTTRADVLAKMGEPDMSFQADVLAGDVEIDPGPGDPYGINELLRRSREEGAKRPLALYDVMQYWDGPKGTSRSSFVFREGEDRLLYAVVKPSPSEETYVKAQGRYGREPDIEQRIHESGHLIIKAIHLVYREEGVELVIDRPDGKVSKKIYVHRDAKGHATLP